MLDRKSNTRKRGLLTMVTYAVSAIFGLAVYLSIYLVVTS